MAKSIGVVIDGISEVFDEVNLSLKKMEAAQKDIASTLTVIKEAQRAGKDVFDHADEGLQRKRITTILDSVGEVKNMLQTSNVEMNKLINIAFKEHKTNMEGSMMKMAEGMKDDKPSQWTFIINRDSDGKITTVDAKEK